MDRPSPCYGCKTAKEKREFLAHVYISKSICKTRYTRQANQLAETTLLSSKTMTNLKSIILWNHS